MYSSLALSGSEVSKHHDITSIHQIQSPDFGQDSSAFGIPSLLRLSSLSVSRFDVPLLRH